MHIHALHLGPIQTLQYAGKKVRTAGNKRSVPSARLNPAGLVGDQQADRRYHGGPDRALCGYGWEHYAEWQAKLGVPLAAGAFSENLTLVGLNEAVVCVGDQYSLGDTGVIIEVASPRQPCVRLAAKLGQPNLVALIKETSYTGCYFRVSGEAEIAVGDELKLRARPAEAVTLREANQVLFRQLRDRESLLRVLAVKALGASWRARLSQRL